MIPKRIVIGMRMIKDISTFQKKNLRLTTVEFCKIKIAKRARNEKIKMTLTFILLIITILLHILCRPSWPKA